MKGETLCHTNLLAAQHVTDVVLVSREGEQHSTHALLLASCSSFLRPLLQEVARCCHPLAILLPDFPIQEVEQVNDALRGIKNNLLENSLAQALGLETDASLLEEQQDIKNEKNQALQLLQVKTDIKLEKQEKVFGEKEFRCTYCSEIFTTSKRKQCHMKLVHQLKYLHYMDKQENGKYICKICQKLYQNRLTIKTHLKAVHKFGQSFKCDVCNKEFSHKDRLKFHTKIHNQEKNQVCDLCGKSFIHDQNLQLHHLKSHGSEEEKIKSQKYACSGCDKHFYRRHVLAQHEQIHSRILRFSCDQCEKEFFTSNARRQHIDKKHLGKNLPTDQQRSKANEQKKKRMAERKALNGGMYRTAEEKVKFNEYMRKYNEKKRLSIISA